MTAISIRLLGRFEVLHNGQLIEEKDWTRKKSKLLLKLLALAPRHEAHREQLIETLWPDAAADAGLNNLHKLLHSLRRTLEPDLKPGTPSQYVLTQDQLICLAPPPLIWIDLDEFDSLAAQGLRTSKTEDLEAALNLYRGQLLEEDPYEDWASLRRETTKLTAEKVMDKLAESCRQTNPPRAAELLEKLSIINPLNEDAQRRLMSLWASMGRRHLALDQYRILSEALQSDLNASPEPATTQLYKQILAGSESTKTAPSAPTAESVQKASSSNSSLLAGITVVLILAALCAWWLVRDRTPGTGHKRSLAILPLATHDGDEDMHAAAEGLTELLINSTSRLPAMRVMAYATMFSFKGRSDGLAIGRELKVSNVLSGQLERDAKNWRLNLELVDTSDGALLWGKRFTAPLDSMESLESTVTAAVASALLAPQDRPKSSDTFARRDSEAQTAYLKGRFFLNERTAAGSQKSIQYFQQAIARDPNYALAYAGLADSYGLLAFADAPPRQNFSKARDAAQRAIELDDSLAEAHTSLAMVKILFDWNWAEAETEFRRAMELNPGYATAHHWYGVNLAAMGRFEEAQRELATAHELDPLSPIITVNLGYPAYYQHRYPEALDAYGKALELKPDFLLAFEDRSRAYEKLGRTADAFSDIKAILTSANNLEVVQQLQSVYDTQGYVAMLKEWLSLYEHRSTAAYVSPMQLAEIAARAGDTGRSLFWLDRARTEHSAGLIYIGVDPSFDGLRQDPRFQKLISSLGLPAKIIQN